MAPSINSLPDEVLENIFSFLDSREKLKASSICKNWMRVMNDHPNILEDVCVVLKTIPFDDARSKRFYDVFSNMSRNFCYFNFGDFNFYVHQFIKKYGPLFRRLHFKGRRDDSYFKSLRKEIKNCTNLWELDVEYNYAWLIFSHLPKLKRLTLKLFDRIFDLDWMPLQEIIPETLTTFNLFFYPSEEYDGIRMTYKPFEDFIWKRRLTLQSLEFFKSDISGEEMVQLSKMKDLRLKCLNLSCCYQFNEILPSFCANQLGIVALSLYGLKNLGDTTVSTLCSTLPKLEELDLEWCKSVSESVEKIFQLKSLRRINFCYCTGIMPDHFIKALERFACHNLEYLDLNFTHADDQFLCQLFPLVPNLRELYLWNCNITDATVCVISKTLTSLRRLNLNGCAITDNGLMGIVDGSKSSPLPLSNIKGLEDLQLRGCGVTESGLVRAIRFESLVFLRLDDSVKLTRTGERAIRNLNPKLGSRGEEYYPQRNCLTFHEKI